MNVTDSKNTLVAAVVVILAMMMAVSGYMMVTLLDKMAGGNPYFHEDSYLVTGNYQGVAVQGNGESRYSAESDNLLIYDFYLDVKDGEGKSSQVHAVLLCTGEGSPTPDFKLISHNVDGTSTWVYQENGTSYEYRIGEKNLVHSLSVKSEEASLTAELII